MLVGQLQFFFVPTKLQLQLRCKSEYDRPDDTCLRAMLEEEADGIIIESLDTNEPLPTRMA